LIFPAVPVGFRVPVKLRARADMAEQLELPVNLRSMLPVALRVRV
jgi:hypothetical protein